jgi:hypothetical protein
MQWGARLATHFEEGDPKNDPSIFGSVELGLLQVVCSIMMCLGVVPIGIARIVR